MILALLSGGQRAARALDGSRPISSYLRRSWSAEQMMSGATITGIAQTPDGYIWVGTSTGLLRFDGQTFSHINPSGNQPALHVLSLTVDSDGGLWIWLEDARVIRYQNGRFDSMLPPANTEKITAVTRTAEGDILLATLGDGILRYSHGKLGKVAPAADAVIISLAQTTDGRLWAGTSENGLYSFDARGGLGSAPRLGATKIDCLLPIEAGRMWVGTDDGLFFWDGRTVNQPDIGASLRHAQIFALVRDRDSNLWIAGSMGLLRLNAQGLSALAVHPEEATPVSTLIEDREGEIWFSDARDLESLRDPLLSSLSTSQGLPANANGSIFVDPAGRLWIAPLRGGLYWYRDGKAHKVTEAGLADDVVYSIDGDQQGIWIGRQRGGVTRIDWNGGVMRVRTWKRLQGLPGNSVYAVYESHDGAVWVASLPNGLSRLVNGRFEPVLPSDGRSVHSVNAVTEGAEGTMWFATANGLIRMRGGNLQIFHQSDGLPSEDVICLAATPQGDLWIGTDGGLALYSAGKTRAVGSGNPLLQGPIFGLAMDRAGMLWIVTSIHILAARAEPLLAGEQAPVARLLTEEDGLLSQQGVRRFRSVALDRRGRVWLSLTRGVSYAAASAFGEIQYPVSAEIEGITADGQPVNLSSDLRVSSVDRRIVLHFAGLSYRFPDQLLYEYRLDNFDRQWSEPTAMREAAYTNLAPGKYKFRVRAARNGDGWRGPEAMLQFQVIPRFWQTWEFDICASLALGLLLFWGWRLRLRQVMSRANLRFEERLAERTRIAQDLHDTLLQGFISASMQLHVVADTIPPSPAKGSLTRILQLMNQVIEDGRRSLRGLRTGATGHSGLEQALISELQSAANPDQTAYRVIVQGDVLKLRPVVRDEVLSIAREALLNVFRHAAAATMEIEIQYDSGEFQFIVRDDGRGMDRHISVNGRDGHWGLPGMRSHAEAIGGKLKILSNPGAGTEISLRIPGSLAYEDLAAYSTGAPTRAIPFLRLKRKGPQRKSAL